MLFDSRLILLAIFVSVDGLFLLEDKEPFFFCLKICPLYCPTKRSDEDASSLIYADDELPPFIYDHEPEIYYPYSHGHSYFCELPPKPTTTTTTTVKPTTQEPTFICQLCMKKCNKKSSK
ncbi:unnamed protein product [Colias eurytheme]|nr:unnamed protein product [Colias eurytheme]